MPGPPFCKCWGVAQQSTDPVAANSPPASSADEGPPNGRSKWSPRFQPSLPPPSEVFGIRLNQLLGIPRNHPCARNTFATVNQCEHRVTIWLFNSSPWKITMLLIGKPSISMGHLYHGYVSHNQRVIWLNHGESTETGVNSRELT